MIIVSQNGKYIINFDNAKGVSIIEYDKYNRKSYEAEIIIRFNDEDIILGKYKTKEGAKEVLQAIVASYQANLIMECTADIATQNQIATKYLEVGATPFKYEMPKE